MTLKNILSKPVAAGCTVGLILLAGVMYPQSTPQRRSRHGAAAGDGSRTAGARSGRLADVAAHVEQLGLQPAESN